LYRKLLGQSTLHHSGLHADARWYFGDLGARLAPVISGRGGAGQHARPLQHLDTSRRLVATYTQDNLVLQPRLRAEGLLPIPTITNGEQLFAICSVDVELSCRERLEADALEPDEMHLSAVWSPVCAP
jgi:hypothetical protein